jgi:hypothetical protein
VGADKEITLLEADSRYLSERIALLRARMYGRGLGSTSRLHELERELERAQERLRHRRAHLAT